MRGVEAPKAEDYRQRQDYSWSEGPSTVQDHQEAECFQEGAEGAVAYESCGIDSARNQDIALLKAIDEGTVPVIVRVAG